MSILYILIHPGDRSLTTNRNSYKILLKFIRSINYSGRLLLQFSKPIAQWKKEVWEIFYITNMLSLNNSWNGKQITAYISSVPSTKKWESRGNNFTESVFRDKATIFYFVSFFWELLCARDKCWDQFPDEYWLPFKQYLPNSNTIFNSRNEYLLI